MIKTITVKQAKRLRDEEDAKGLKFIDKVDIDDKGKYQVIFKKRGNNQLYSFNYIFNYLLQLPNFGVSDIVKTLERPYYSLDSIENHNEYHIEVKPVKKITVNKQVKAIKYALTPLDEREDEPRFYVRMVPKDSGGNSDVYLNLNKEYSFILIDDSCNDSNVQTIFTKSEYDKLQQEYSEWLPKFDKNDPHFEIIGDR